MTGKDYNLVLSIFYISYIVFEIPATVTCKSIGPGYVRATSLWGVSMLIVYPKLVPARHLSWIRALLHLHSFRLDRPSDLRRPICPGDFRSRHAPGNSVLYVAVVPACGAHVPPVHVHRDGFSRWSIWRSLGLCNSAVAPFREVPRLADDIRYASCL